VAGGFLLHFSVLPESFEYVETGDARHLRTRSTTPTTTQSQCFSSLLCGNRLIGRSPHL
jgi:hypothetical protein